MTDLITDRALEYLKELGEATPRSICLSTILHPILPGKRSTILQSGSITTMAARFPAFQTCRIIPICAPARYMEPVRGKKICVGYFAAISAMDEQIGRLLDAVEEQGLADNTVILFTADNGMSMGQHGVWGKGNGHS
ncbi:MAG: sulfatase-like hydrolase/transferase [Gallintestinimicrobium sp.]